MPRFKASISNGYKVPRSTEPAATTKKTLPKSINVSRDIKEKAPPNVLFGALKAYRNKDEPTTKESRIKIKMPRRGSVAKACTDVRTPERTKKVPSKDIEKAIMARSTVQFLKPPRFSVTAKECNKAVPISHGMNEAFSTGSQNHQPPQPNS